MPYEKVGKNEPICIADEVPFDIPESWEWTRIGNVFQINPRNNLPDELETGFVPMALLSDGFCSRHSYEPKKWKDIKNGFTHFANNDIVIAKITPCFQNRKSAVVTGLPNGFGAGTTELHVLRDNTKELFMPYFLLICKTQAFIQNGVKNFSGTAGQQRIGKDFISKYLIPVPPVSEQERIVQRLHLLEPLLISYENAYDSIVNQQKNFPAQLKRSILQYAVQGKLVSQNPADEPAAILLEHIRAEKEKLIKSGKIKRDKHESFIFRRDNSYYEQVDGIERCIDDELPFEIPKSWEWTRLSTIAKVLGGKRIPAGRKLTAENTGHVYIRVSDMKDGTVIQNGLLYVPEDIFNSISKYIIKKEDVFITVAGTIGRIGKIPPELDGANLTENADRLVFSSLNQDWMIFLLQSSFIQNQIAEVTTKVGQPKLAIARIEKLLIPLPPLNEQTRIVEQIAVIFSQMKKL